MIIDESCSKKVKKDTGQIMSGNCDGVGKDTHVFFQQIPWGLTIKYWSADGLRLYHSLAERDVLYGI